MTKELLDEREFELVNIIGAELAANQRDLSRQMNMSLGMTNMLLRRLITKGYIRISQLNSKKVQYLLTSKGFAEKMRKSVKYTLKTIDSIGLVKRNLSVLIKSWHSQGVRKFYILGGEDLAGLIEMTVHEQFADEMKLFRVEALDKSMRDGMVLICREGVSVDGFEDLRTVNVVEELAKNEALAR